MTEHDRIEIAKRRGTIKRLHVDKRMIAQRAPNPLTIQTSRGSFKATRVKISGPSEFVYSPDDPLSCGARLWVETRAPVEVIE